MTRTSQVALADHTTLTKLQLCSASGRALLSASLLVYGLVVTAVTCKGVALAVCVLTRNTTAVGVALVKQMVKAFIFYIRHSAVQYMSRPTRRVPRYIQMRTKSSPSEAASVARQSTSRVGERGAVC